MLRHHTALVFFFALSLLFGACTWRYRLGLAQAPKAVFLVQNRVIDCFEPGLTYEADTVLVYCEASALALVDGTVFFASDKPTPAHISPIMRLPYREPLDDGLLAYVRQPELEAFQKIEEMALTPDSAYIAITTAFDRARPDGTWDAYNALALWDWRQNRVSLVQPDSARSEQYSVAYRERFRTLLGWDYFKIEGLTFSPDGRLLFGVRETGPDYKFPRYVIKILGCHYRIEDGRLHLEDDLELLLDFDPEGWGVSGLQEPVALSALHYDVLSGRYYMLTSMELEQGIGGYLWVIRPEALRPGGRPELVRQPDGRPLFFLHKPEGIAVVDRQTLLIIHDDDRLTNVYANDQIGRYIFRQPHQAVYSLVKMLD